MKFNGKIEQRMSERTNERSLCQIRIYGFTFLEATTIVALANAPSAAATFYFLNKYSFACQNFFQ